MRVAAPLALRNGDRERLASMASLAGSAGAARRARMVLLAADGADGAALAGPVPGGRDPGAAGPAPVRPAADGRRGGDRGPHARVAAEAARGDALVVPATGRDLGISSASVVETWCKWHLQPWLRQSFKFSADPALDAKLSDVVGLYIAPPENAVVVCVTRRPGSRRQTRPSRCCRRGPDCLTRPVQHGTTALFAALDVATRQVTDTCYSRHRHQEFLRFLKKVAAACLGCDLHVVCDNCTTHEHPEVRAWLAKIPRVTLHFTPTGCSWLSMVEIFFAIITRGAMRGGTCCSSKDLSAKIGAFIDGWNEHFELFAWIKPRWGVNAQVRDLQGAPKRWNA